jgi:hypothetical protein
VKEDALKLARIAMREKKHLTAWDLATLFEQYADRENKTTTGEQVKATVELRRLRKAATDAVKQIKKEVAPRWGDKPGVHGLAMLNIAKKLERLL